jgi:glycosyltransferase involved in cell wall biosynthesis
MNVLQMCRVLTRAGWLVDLATYPFGEDVALPGLRIHRAPRVPGVRGVPIGFSFAKVLLDVALATTVAGLLLRRRYRAIHAVEESVFLALPLTWLGIPVIYDLDSLISDQLAYTGVLRHRRLLAAVRACERLALARAAAAITVCRSLTEAARALHPGARLFQIEDAPLEETLRPPDPERVAALRREWKLEGAPAVVYTGNLEGYQGIDLLLAAGQLLRRRVPEARLVLVGGEAAQVAALRARLDAQGLVESVVLVGRRPTAEMAEWMALAKVLVSPRAEGTNTPLKIYTYMRCGVPIVATDLPTHTQVLDETSAVLCPPTPDGLAAGMARALLDPSVGGLALCARERAERDFGAAAFERKLLAAYDFVTRV